MSEENSPQRVTAIWSPEARSALRAIERSVAMEILACLTRYLTSRTGDVKKLKHPLTGFRLRCGEYRIFFGLRGASAIEITGIRNRRYAYR